MLTSTFDILNDKIGSQPLQVTVSVAQARILWLLVCSSKVQTI